MSDWEAIEAVEFDNVTPVGLLVTPWRAGTPWYRRLWWGILGRRHGSWYFTFGSQTTP